MSDAFWDNLFKLFGTIFAGWMMYKVQLIGRQTDGISTKLAAAEYEKGFLKGGAEERREQGRPPAPREEPIPPPHPRNGPQLNG
jgi:hypothetical protein